MLIARSSKTCFLAATSFFALALGSAHAQERQAAAASTIEGPIETIVVTGTRFDAESAPAKASLETTQPETIISRSYIEDFLAPTADYVGVLAIAPSLTGTDTNGPGLSDGGAKNTLRGLPDGSYGMSFDGVPFGDTNGPSHHSLSYFPASTIGAVLVDRGPGNAGTLGAATYGGTIKLFSEQLSQDLRAKGAISYGSFNTLVASANGQTGAMGGEDNSTRAMLNLQYTGSDGALSLQDVKQRNALLKVEHDFGQDWKLTVFGAYTYLAQHLSDNPSLTPAQIATYGKNYALQNTNPNLSNFVEYNWVNKKTDMDYARLQGNLSDTLSIDNTLYTYFYLNHTFSATNLVQTATEIAAGTTQGQGGKVVPIVNGVKQPATDSAGYTKVNAFRVWGDVLRVTQDYELGAVSGQVRTGVWWEGQKTWRGRYDFDRSLCYRLNIDPFHVKDTSACADSQLVASGGAVKLPNGYAEYDEHTSWYQYQPFLEVDIVPVDGLTITPGVKYINWLHKANGLIQTLIKPFAGSFTTEKTLPFLEVHYKITPSWSVYAQYAQGVYVPDIKAFEQKTGPATGFPDAQTSTNYQVGTVFYADNFSFDADFYDIPINNNISYVSCSTIGGKTGETCAVNTGRALYKGVEGQATYAFKGAGGWLDGLSVFANGSIMSAKSGGLWLRQAPQWTLAGGVIYKADRWKFAVIDKTVGQQYSDNAETQAYKLPAYSLVNLSAGYSFEHVEIDLSVDNLFNSRNTVALAVNDKTYQTNQMLSINSYAFQAPLSVMGTIKVHF